MRGDRPRALLIVGLTLVLMALHTVSDARGADMRSLHVLGRQAFALPVLLAAIWFRRRTLLALLAAVTLFYTAHVTMQWTGPDVELRTEVSEVSLLWVLGVVASLLIERERRALDERARLGEGALVALVMAIDAREHNTRMHSLRVREYAVRLGRELGVRGRALDDLARGALLHDIGKIGIPDTVLSKPGPLDQDEWSVMRRHPEIGAGVLEPVGFLAPAREFVLAHHERFDGKGYPRGLRGEEIPLGARIFAVIDALDALTSDRPYRRAIPFPEAVALLERDRGTHFDPAVLDAFLGVPASEWQAIRGRVDGAPPWRAG